MTSRISVTLMLLVAVATMFFTANGVDANSRPQGTMLRYGSTLPAYAPHVLYRFYNSRQFPSLNKRNNAEVVNHILKNFGALDRLGDVGK